MQRVHAFISGEVQGVGYREEVKRIAFGSNICGWIMNLEDGRVEIIAEGENRNIEEFLDKMSIKKYPIFVENITIEEEIFKGEFRSFRIIRDKDVQKELLSALSRGTVDIHEMKEILQTVKQDTSAMLVKQDRMLEKQDATIDLLKSVKDDTSKIPQIVENTSKILEHTSKIPEIVENTSKILEHTSKIPEIAENTSKIPEIVENTSNILKNTSKIMENTSPISAMREDTASIRYDTKEIATKLWDKYEEMSKEIAEMKITLSRIEAKVFG